jgi:hypothetical protein
MTMKESGEILEEIGRMIDDQLEGNSENAFLYSEVEQGSGFGYILEDVGDHLIYHLADTEIIWKVMALWEQLPKRKRWQALRYAIKDGRFEAEFDYPRDIDQDELDDDRVRRILRARAGNRQIDHTVAWEKSKHLFEGLDVEGPPPFRIDPD